MAFNKSQVEAFFERTKYELEKGRPTMDALRKRANKIVRDLKNEKRFEPVDETLVETLVMAIEIRDRAMMEIIENGILMYVDKKQTIKQKNHAISTFYQMAKTIMDISKKLGMSPLDRMELKLERKEGDGFDD